mmetsp:Transcript_35662/g.80053  ORF Transcript_35662/g.80053 Transcript_35662/m.80053 type:complete len:234 (+) Transcript_35662:1264-1965(+)
MSSAYSITGWRNMLHVSVDNLSTVSEPDAKGLGRILKLARLQQCLDFSLLLTGHPTSEGPHDLSSRRRSGIFEGNLFSVDQRAQLRELSRCDATSWCTVTASHLTYLLDTRVSLPINDIHIVCKLNHSLARQKTLQLLRCYLASDFPLHLPAPILQRLVNLPHFPSDLNNLVKLDGLHLLQKISDLCKLLRRDAASLRTSHKSSITQGFRGTPANFDGVSKSRTLLLLGQHSS